VPVHFGLAVTESVTVEVISLIREGRKTLRVSGVEPRDWIGRPLVVGPE
jgi:hypothetical protein